LDIPTPEVKPLAIPSLGCIERDSKLKAESGRLRATSAPLDGGEQGAQKVFVVTGLARLDPQVGA
jgi:hypothetical protein